jgi:alkylation response protein AidB-like acyl-CoA dehydrogenase
VAAFLTKHCSPALVRSVCAGELEGNEALWQRCVAELDLPGTCLPVALGGAGGDRTIMTVILEELGAVLAPVPYLSSGVIATDVLLALAPGAARDRLLTDLAAGRTACVAFAEGLRPDWRTTVASRAEEDRAGRLTVTGEKTFVLGAVRADWIIVSAAGRTGPAIFAVEANSPSVDFRVTRGADLTRPLATVVLRGVPALELGGDAGIALARAWDTACLGLAAEMLGGMRRCVDMSVDYAKVRYQFGRPIGSFQAIKHICAGMYVKLELSRAAVRRAAVGLDTGTGTVDTAIAVGHVGRFFREVAADTIHVHGGVGFSWEHDAHLYYRRALSSSLLLGGQDDHADRLVELLGL